MIATVVTHEEIVAVRDLLRTTVGPLVASGRDDDPPFMLFVYTIMLNLFNRLVGHRAEVSRSEVQEAIAAGREAEAWRLRHMGVDRFSEWRPTILDVLDRLLEEYPDPADQEDHPIVRVTPAELRRARGKVLEGIRMAEAEPRLPPGAKWLWRNMLAVLDRAIDGNRDLPAREVREIYIAMREAAEWRVEHEGFDAHADRRAYVMEVFDRLADELPDSTADMPCPIPPLGVRIRDRRIIAGLTQEELAHEVGVDHMTVSRWENDRGREPGARYRSRLAKILGGKPSEYTRDE
jgi:DNA-binding XRE family transcriptional regulator